LRVAAGILNKQPQTNNKGWSYSLGIGRGANNTFNVKNKFVMKTKQSLRPGWILWINDPSDGIWT
jgi:hypothetical protein